MASSYVQPMVMVYQEYAATSNSTASTTLPPCIIGPCYHIVDATDDEALALIGTYTETGFSSVFFPNNRAGAKILKDSVVVRLKNIKARIVRNVPVASREANVITFTAENYPEYVAVGDYVVVTDVTDAANPVESSTEYRVVDFDADAFSVSLNRSISVGTQHTVTILRLVDELVLPGNSTGITMDATSERISVVGQKILLDNLLRDIVKVEAYVGYMALRQDLSEVNTLYTVDEIEGRLGKIVPENPLAFGVNIAMANSSNVGIQCIGVDSDDVVGYTAAKDRLESHDTSYSLVPLTMDAGILNIFKMHAEAMSQPDVGLWRIAFGCSPLVTEEKACDGSARPSRDGDNDFVVLTDHDASFLSAMVDSGDIVRITDGTGVVHEHTVSTVVSEDIITLTQSNALSDTAFLPTNTYDYEIYRVLDRATQAQRIGATSTAYASRRFVHVWPDVCVVDDRELPGYYLSCAVAGGIGSLPPHQGLTGLSIAGVSGVRHSTDYFNAEQLNIMANGGTFIFMQASPTAPPHIRHQLTTDRSTIEFQELSFVKNFDYICYICRDVLDAFIGQCNITEGSLAMLSTSLNAVLETQKLSTQPKIGAPILGYDIVSVAQLEDVRDRVEMYVEVDFPYPLNTIGLHLVSR